MASLSLKNIKKIYPFSGDDIKKQKRAAKMMAQREQMLAQQQAQQKKAQPTKKKAASAPEKKEKYSGSTNEAGRVGNRPYARGRAFSENHYED